jgi:hypothetical protein
MYERHWGLKMVWFVNRKVFQQDWVLLTSFLNPQFDGMPHIKIQKSYTTRQGADTVQFIKPFRLRRHGHVEKMQNQRITKQTATAETRSTKKEEDRLQNGNTKLKRTKI